MKVHLPILYAPIGDDILPTIGMRANIILYLGEQVACNSSDA